MTEMDKRSQLADPVHVPNLDLGTEVQRSGLAEITLRMNPESDQPMRLAYCMSNMGSIAADRHEWAAVLDALGIQSRFQMYDSDRGGALDEVAERLVTACVPEEGEIHPQRATYTTGEGSVTFHTPGGVSVTLSRADDGSLEVRCDFGRDSQYLASCILMSDFLRGECSPSEKRHIAALLSHLMTAILESGEGT